MKVYVCGYIEIDADEDDDIREEVGDFFGKAKVDFDLDEVEVCEDIEGTIPDFDPEKSEAA